MLRRYFGPSSESVATQPSSFSTPCRMYAHKSSYMGVPDPYSAFNLFSRSFPGVLELFNQWFIGVCTRLRQIGRSLQVLHFLEKLFGPRNQSLLIRMHRHDTESSSILLNYYHYGDDTSMSAISDDEVCAVANNLLRRTKRADVDIESSLFEVNQRSIHNLYIMNGS
jgi:hypothetical protein